MHTNFRCLLANVVQPTDWKTMLRSFLQNNSNNEEKLMNFLQSMKVPLLFLSPR